MGRYKKKDMLYLVSDLQTINSIIGESEKLDLSSVVEALAECQDKAVELGTYIETLDGEHSFLIRNLEDYCENLYQLSMKLIDKKEKKKICIKIIEQLSQIKGNIRYHIPDEKKEVLFLPYKVSMWDSLESIWLAANRDEQCEVKVIPIPYYNRKPDGTLGEMHDESSQMPKYVPITDWKTYDLKESRPDIVYIHNPYDNTNYVTVVHPRFFSDEIKKYAEILVYCPYFYTGGYMSETHSLLRAYLYADFIITQSEKMEPYFHPQIRSKLLPLGSPKVDRILQFQDKKYLSRWWKDAEEKKYFLLNLSISSVLAHNEAQLRKIQYIVECFKKFKTAVLVWRPHPLLAETLRAMRPELLEKYQEITAEIRKLGNAVIDENADVTISVCAADAYIGESSSSMVALFGVQGKPVFITKTGIVEDYTPDIKVEACFDCQKCDERLWAIGGFSSYLYELDLDFTVVGQYEIPGELLDGERLYNQIVLSGKKIILVPYHACEIAVFDRETHSFTKYGYRNAQKDKYVSGIADGEKIYMIPAIGESILEFDLTTEMVCYHSCGIPAGVVRDVTKPVFFNGTFQVGRELYLFAAQTNQVLIFDIDTKKRAWKTVKGLESGVWACVYWNGKCYLASNEGCFLAIWDLRSESVKKLTDFPKEFSGETQCFNSMVAAQDRIVIFPQKGNKILSLNPISYEISVMDLGFSYCEGARKSAYYSWPSNYLFARMLNSRVAAAMSAYDNSLLIFDLISGECKSGYVRSENGGTDISRKFRKVTDNIPYACAENKKATLSMFVNYVSTMSGLLPEEIKAYERVINYMDGTSGTHIHEQIIKRLEERL